MKQYINKIQHINYNWEKKRLIIRKNNGTSITLEGEKAIKFMKKLS
jgi:hypothetical protein